MILRLVGLMLFIQLAIACTHSIDLDKSDINVLKKSLLDGEWFHRATLVDKHSHSALSFIGVECPVELINFAITKDKLLAYRGYQKGDLNRAKDESQTLVAAFPIISHFDFNQSVIDESSSKPWYEREYIRVDWSENLVPHLECNQWLQSITTTKIARNDWVDPLDLFRVRIEKDYIESTVGALVEPDLNACNELGELACNSASYRVKYSFNKVNNNNDYVPRHYPDVELIKYGIDENGFCLEEDYNCKDTKELWLYSDAHRTGICDPLKDNIENCTAPHVKLNSQFGFFRTENQNYDRQEGFSKKGQEQLINRWNIWQKNQNADHSIIPLKYRVPKKIIYYLNAGFPAELIPSTKKVAEQWSIALANVVAKLKNQCNMETAERMINKYGLRNHLANLGIYSLVPENLSYVCKEIYEHSKNFIESEIFFTGDPMEVIATYGALFEIKENDCNQRNVYGFIKQNNLAKLLIKYDIADISDKNIEQTCAFLEWISVKQSIDPPFKWQQIGDLRYSFVNGVKKPESAGLLGYGPAAVHPKTGEIISANANIYLAAISNYASKAVLLMTQLEELNHNQSTDSDAKDMISEPSLLSFSKQIHDEISSFSTESYQVPKNDSHLVNNLNKVNNLRAFAQIDDPLGSAVLAKLMDGSHKENEFLSLASLMNTDKHEMNDLQNNLTNLQAKNEFFSQRSACFFQHDHDVPYVRLSKELEGKSILEKIQYLTARVLEGVLLHEIGHTLGLRHNFYGGFDALNFPPTFWQVDTADYRARPGLDEEELRSSSVMHYHNSFNSNFSGLGLYDYAALLSGYGEQTEVFDNLDNDFVPHNLMPLLGFMNYRDLPFIFAGADAGKKIMEHFKRVRDQNKLLNNSTFMNIKSLNITPNPSNIYQRKTIDHRSLKQLILEEALGDNGSSLMQVPYKFCSDKAVMMNEIGCRPYSYGSSASEIIENAIKEYELLYKIRSVNSMALPNDVPSYLSYVYTRVYAPILRTYQHRYRLMSNNLQIYPAVRDLNLGVKQGLHFISQVLQAVEPGTYCKDNDENYVLEIDGNECRDPIKIKDHLGKTYHSKRVQSLGGGAENVGYIYDKILALLALVDDTAIFNHEFNHWQTSSYSIGLYRIFDDEINNLFASFYTDKWQNMAPLLKFNAEGEPVIEYPNLFDKNELSSLSTSAKIKPSSSASLKRYAIVFSMAGLSNHNDHKLDFAKKSQIRLLTHNNDRAFDSMEQIIFKDPHTGIAYQAFAPLEEKKSAAYLLLKDAALFVQDEREEAGPWIITKRQLHKATQAFEQAREGVINTDGNDEKMVAADNLNQARIKFNLKEHELNEKIRTIDLVRSLSDRFAQ